MHTHTHTHTHTQTHKETLWQLVQDVQQLSCRPYKQEMTNLKSWVHGLDKLPVKLVESK